MATDQKTADDVTGRAGTCGTCKHGVRRDIDAVECFGVPPMLIAMGGRQLPSGQMQLAIEKFRPMMKPLERACSLYQFAFAQDAKFEGPVTTYGVKPENGGKAS